MADFERRLQLKLPSPTQFFTPAVTVFLVLIIIGFAFTTYASEFVFNTLALSSQGVFHGKVWQLITYPFVEISTCRLIPSGIILLFFGSAVERQWKTRGFLALFFLLSVSCGLLWLVISLLLGRSFIGLGMTGCAYGIIATFGILYKGQKLLFFFFVVEAQYLAMLLIAIGLVVSIAFPINLIWVAGALIAYIYTKIKWRIASNGASKRFESSQLRAGGFVDVD